MMPRYAASTGGLKRRIELSLHGVTDIDSPFYRGPDTAVGGVFGTEQRHFDLDKVGPVGDLAPDGLIR